MKMKRLLDIYYFTVQWLGDTPKFTPCFGSTSPKYYLMQEILHQTKKSTLRKTNMDCQKTLVWKRLPFQFCFCCVSMLVFKGVASPIRITVQKRIKATHPSRCVKKHCQLLHPPPRNLTQILRQLQKMWTIHGLDTWVYRYMKQIQIHGYIYHLKKSLTNRSIVSNRPFFWVPQKTNMSPLINEWSEDAMCF